jgi:hypothetical protein
LGRKLQIEGYEDGKKNLTKLLFFHPDVQRVYKAWIRELYTTENPHTGLTIAEDPAVFALEVCNEDSLWWFGVGNLKGEPRRLLQERFGAWAADRYGSCRKALDAWGGDAREEDAPGEGRLEVVLLWFMTRDGRASGQVPEQRINDQVRFLVDLQKGFHREIKQFIKEDLGCKQYVSASNFKSVDLAITEDALRLGYQPMDLICKNHYFSSGGKQDTPGWRLDAGDIMGLRSAVKTPLELPVRMRQVEGKPFIITETLWSRMHPFETEGPLVLAAYQAALGLDGIWWAGPRDVTWNDDPYRRFWRHKGSFAMGVFDNAQPGGMGQSPAAALMLRHAGLKSAPTMVHEYRTREEIVTGQLPLTSEGGYHDFVYEDEERDQGAGPSEIPAEVFLVGRVAVEYVDEDRPSEVRPIGPHLDGSIVRSATGELMMDAERRLFTVNAPRAQAATGFLEQAGPVELDTVTFHCGNEHASLTMVSLDEEPLASSSNILLQVGLPARPTGWKESKTTFEDRDGNEKHGLLVEATGQMPWRVQNTDLRVELRNPGITEALLLDGNGLPARKVELERSDDGVVLSCPPNSMYIVFTAE